MSDITAPQSGFRIKGWHVGLGVTAFFGIVTALDVWFVTLAYGSFPGEVSETPYEDGLAYNAVIEARARQAELGWTARVQQGTPGVVRVAFADEAGEPLTGLSLSGQFARPATETQDRVVVFQEVAPGLYEGRAQGAGEGAWDLRFSARDGRGAVFDAERRLVWR